jgi:hypothetical protein
MANLRINSLGLERKIGGMKELLRQNFRGLKAQVLLYGRIFKIPPSRAPTRDLKIITYFDCTRIRFSFL